MIALLHEHGIAIGGTLCGLILMVAVVLTVVCLDRATTPVGREHFRAGGR